MRRARPGHDWDCHLNGGFGYLGSRKAGLSSSVCDDLAIAGELAATAKVAPPPLTTSRREGEGAFACRHERGTLSFARFQTYAKNENRTRLLPSRAKVRTCRMVFVVRIVSLGERIEFDDRDEDCSSVLSQIHV